MTLFLREKDKSKIKFNCLGLSAGESFEMKKLIEENGGEMCKEIMPVRFIPRRKYREQVHAHSMMYDIEYINTCVRKQRLVKLSPFRLGKKKFAEQCISSNFIYGRCSFERKLAAVRVSDSPVIFDTSSGSNDEVPRGEISPPSNGRRLLIDDEPQPSTNIGGSPSEVSRSKNVRRSLIDESQPVVPGTGSGDLRCSSLPSEYASAQEDICIVKEEIPESMDWGVDPLLPQSSPSSSLPPATSLISDPLAIPKDDASLPSSPDVIDSSLPETTNASTTDAATNSTIQISQSSQNSKWQSATVPQKSSSLPNLNASTSRVSERPRLIVKSDIRLNATALRELREASIEKASNPSGWKRATKPSKSRKTVAEHELSDGTTVPLLRRDKILPAIAKESGRMLLNPNWCPVTAKRTKKTVDDQASTSGTDVDDGASTSRPTITVKTDLWNEPTPRAQSPWKKRRVSTRLSDEVETHRKTMNKRKLYTSHPENSGSSAESDSGEKSEERSTVMNGRNENSQRDWAQSGERSPPRAAETGKEWKGKQKLQQKPNGAETNSEEKIVILSSDTESDFECNTQRSPQKEQKKKLTDGPTKNDDKKVNKTEDSSSGGEGENGEWKPKKSRKQQASTYARQWRHQLDADRPTDQVPTKMYFTRVEEQMMVDYLLTYKKIVPTRPKGLKVWQQMINRGIMTYRTSQSLQSHFTKIMLPRIESFYPKMTEEQRRQFDEIKNPTR